MKTIAIIGQTFRGKCYDAECVVKSLILEELCKGNNHFILGDYSDFDISSFLNTITSRIYYPDLKITIVTTDLKKYLSELIHQSRPYIDYRYIPKKGFFQPLICYKTYKFIVRKADKIIFYFKPNIFNPYYAHYKLVKRSHKPMINAYYVFKAINPYTPKYISKHNVKFYE